MTVNHEMSTKNDRNEATVAVIKAHLKDAMNEALGRYGTGNMYAASMTMYDTLFGYKLNETIKSYAPPIDESLMNPDRTVPTREEFSVWFREALVHDRAFQKACEFPGAIEAVDQMLNAGPTIIWTEGDTRHGVGDAPGSGEQLEKIRGTGVFDRGVEKAMATVALTAGKSISEDPGEMILTTAVDRLIAAEASESKFSQDAIDRVVGHLRGQNVTNVVVLEDRLGNAIRMQQILESNGFTARGIWVRQGRHGRKEGVHGDDILEASTIAQASELIRDLRGEVGQPIGTVCDFDGVIGDQEKREQLQAERIYDECVRQGWLA
jgi:hypothetical protein